MQNAPNTSWQARLKSYPFWVFVIPFVMYILTAPRTVTFEDSGLFLLSGFYGGVPHPPGYPLYTFLAHLFTYLPVGPIAFRISLLSAVLGSLSAVLLYKILQKIFHQHILAVLGALIFAFAATVWGQMIVAEVYALHIFLNLLFFYQCLKLQDGEHRKGFFILGLFGALALSNHWPLFVLSGPAFLLLTRRGWWRANYLAAFFAGLSFFVIPYLLMWWRSQTPNLEIAFLGPIEGLSDLVKYFMRSYYSATDASVLHTWRDKVLFFGDFLKGLSFDDFSPLTVPLFLLGLWQLWKDNTRKLLLPLLFLFLSSSGLLLLFLKLEFNDLNQNIQQVFWLTPYFAYVVIVVFGALFLEKWQRWAGVVGLALILASQLLFNFRGQNMREDRFAEDYGRVILESLPEQAVLVASTDGDVGPVSYTNKVVGVRPGVRMYTGTSVFFKDRMYNPRIGSLKTRLAKTTDFIKSEKVVYSIKNLNVFEGQKDLPVVSTFNGLTYKYTPYAEPADPVSDQVVQLAVQALDGYAQGRYINNWPYHRGTLAARLCNLLVLRGNENHPVFDFAPECQQVLARHLMATGRREAADAMYLRYFQHLKWPITREKQQYAYHFLINRLEIVNALKGQGEKQMAMLREALTLVEPTLFEYPLCDNMVYPVLKSIRGQVPLSPQADAQLAVFAKCADSR